MSSIRNALENIADTVFFEIDHMLIVYMEGTFNACSPWQGGWLPVVN